MSNPTIPPPTDTDHNEELLSLLNELRAWHAAHSTHPQASENVKGQREWVGRLILTFERLAGERQARQAAEAENARLREAVRQSVDRLLHSAGIAATSDVIDMLLSALARKGGQPEGGPRP